MRSGGSVAVSARTVTNAIAARKLETSPITESKLSKPESGFATKSTPNSPIVAAKIMGLVTFSFKNNHAISGMKIGEE